MAEVKADRLLTLFAAASMTLVGVPATAVASTGPVAASMSTPAAFFKKSKKKKGKKKKKKSTAKKKSDAPTPEPGLTPEQAATKRQAIRDSVSSKMESDKLAAASGLEEGARQLGDPVTMMEAGELRLQVAKAERDIGQAEASIESSATALDMLYFYVDVASGAAESTWLVIEPNEASGMIATAEGQISEAESLIAEIEDDQYDKTVARAEKKEKKQKKKRGPAKPGTGLIVGGTLFTVAGVAGAGLAFAGLAISNKAQSDVEKLGDDPANQPKIDELDAKGGRANRMAYIGLGIGIAGLAVGLPMLIVGAKKRKQAGGGGKAAQVQVGPMMTGATNGVMVQGRF